MAAKGDDEPLRKVIGSKGGTNQAIKDWFRKLVQRNKPPRDR